MTEVETVDLAGSHHGDPSLTLFELETCMKLVKEIKNAAVKPDWLPSDRQIEDWSRLMSVSKREAKTCKDMVRWIEISREERPLLGVDWVPSYPDILKSRLFWRIRSGKQPLKYPPPTAFSCPWYELIEETRAHWAYDCYVHKPGEPSLWGRYDMPIANIGQCPYEIMTWSDKEETLPFSVSYGPYMFRTFYGPYETYQFDTIAKSVSVVTLQGWWIKHVPNPSEEGAFDLAVDQLPYKIEEHKTSLDQIL